MKRHLTITIDAEDAFCVGCDHIVPGHRIGQGDLDQCLVFGDYLSDTGAGPIRSDDCLSAEAAASRARMPEEVRRALGDIVRDLWVSEEDRDAALAWLEVHGGE